MDLSEALEKASRILGEEQVQPTILSATTGRLESALMNLKTYTMVTVVIFLTTSPLLAQQKKQPTIPPKSQQSKRSRDAPRRSSPPGHLSVTIRSFASVNVATSRELFVRVGQLDL